MKKNVIWMQSEYQDGDVAAIFDLLNSGQPDKAIERANMLLEEVARADCDESDNVQEVSARAADIHISKHVPGAGSYSLYALDKTMTGIVVIAQD